MTANDELRYCSAGELARRYRRGETTATEVTSQALDRIAATEPHLHAYVEILGDTALDQAAAADRALADGGDLGPLHGIPVGIKDIVDMAGLPTRCGSAGRAAVGPAERDATIITRLRAGGAIPIGKTVTQEYAAGVVSAPARNPWDPDRVPGGSSGGSAASVASGGCVVAVGTDTGGSIRIPASLTGTVGLKPTYGTVPTTGIFPLSWSLDTAGSIARDVADVETFFNVLRGEPNAPLGSDAADGSLRGVRVGVPRSFFFDHLEPDVLTSVQAAVSTLRGLGAAVIEVEWPEARHARAASIIISRAESSEVHADEFARNPDGYGPDIRSRLAMSQSLPARDYVLALRARAYVRRTIADLYRAHDLDVLVTPTLCATAARADHLFVRLPAMPPLPGTPSGESPVFVAYTMLTMPFNATGQPAISVPCGFDRAGLPIGLQIVGQPHEEKHLCRIARTYELAAGWIGRRPPL